MKEHLPFEGSRQGDLSSQDLAIKNSNITNTEISQASRDSYKADGNMTTVQSLVKNYYIQKVISSKTKNDLETLKELERAVESKYSEKFRQVAFIVSELRTQVEKQLAVLPEKYRDETLKLIDDLQSIIGYETALDEIREELAVYQRVSNWLRDNVDHLIDIALVKVFSEEYQHFLKPRKNCLGIQKIKDSNIYTLKIKSRFSNDLNVYLGWILFYMQNGSNPKDFKSSFVYLDFEDAVYKQAFKVMKHEVIAPEVSNLSINEARIIARYMNRFIIDRNLSRDARKLF